MHTRTAPDDSPLESAALDRALPVIETVLRRRCRGWTAGGEALDDLRGEVVVRLLRRLRETSGTALPVIENFDAYVAGIASRVVDDAIRISSPEWARLKHRVRYLVTHDSRFLFSVRDSGPAVSLIDDPVPPRSVRTAAARDLATKVIAVLRGAGRALALDDLVNALAAESGVCARVVIPHPPFSVEDPTAASESREALRGLWAEIAALLPRQRAALLLHARDSGGESVLRLLFATAIVSSADAAAALEIHPRDLASLLDDLPLSDSVIARRLGVTPQQVINLRKAARDRLARRMSRPR